MRMLAGSILITALVFSAPVAARAASFDEVGALKKQVADLNAKVMELEQKLAAKEQASPGAAPGTLPVRRSAASSSVYNAWDPFDQMDAMEQRMQAMMAHPFGPGYGTGGSLSPLSQLQMNAFNPGYDLKETDKSYVVTFDIPGMDKSKINVEVKEGVLYVSGERSSENQEKKGDRFYRQERSFGYFSRSIPLPDDAKADSVQAKYDNGVLTVTVDRKESAPKPQNAAQRIEVK